MITFLSFLKFKSIVDGDTRGPGHWKVGNSVANDATFINEMQENLMTKGLMVNFSSTKLGTLRENTH